MIKQRTFLAVMAKTNSLLRLNGYTKRTIRPAAFDDTTGRRALKEGGLFVYLFLRYHGHHNYSSKIGASILHLAHFFLLYNELYELNEFMLASYLCNDWSIGQEVIRLIRKIRCLIKTSGHAKIGL